MVIARPPPTLPALVSGIRAPAPSPPLGNVAGTCFLLPLRHQATARARLAEGARSRGRLLTSPQTRKVTLSRGDDPVPCLESVSLGSGKAWLQAIREHSALGICPPLFEHKPASGVVAKNINHPSTVRLGGQGTERPVVFSLLARPWNTVLVQGNQLEYAEEEGQEPRNLGTQKRWGWGFWRKEEDRGRKTGQIPVQHLQTYRYS